MENWKDVTTQYKGHNIKRENHYVNAYIHYKYTVTGPLFDKPFECFNKQLAKREISDRIKLHSEG